MGDLRKVSFLAVLAAMGISVTGTAWSDDGQARVEARGHRGQHGARDRRPEQVWEGKLEVGAGLSLRIVIHVGKTAEGKLAATMDSPDQGAKGLKVDAVTLDKTTLAFEMKKILGKYEGKLNAEGTEATGTWTQAGNAAPHAEEDGQGHRAAQARRRRSRRFPTRWSRSPIRTSRAA